MSDSAGAYNAVTYLLDRNVAAGRGEKVVFRDPVSEITYGGLEVETRRLGNLLRRLGVRREERVAMMMLDTIDFPIVFLGSIRAGIVPVPLNTKLGADTLEDEPRPANTAGAAAPGSSPKGAYSRVDEGRRPDELNASNDDGRG